MEHSAKRAGMSAKALERIGDHLARAYVDPGKIAGCQVLVARHGHVAYSRTLGLMDRERAKPWADDAIVRIYSMTKPITSVALMMLFEQGYFQLDDPVARFAPEWRDHRVWVAGEGEAMETAAPNRPVSFRDVLCHTGGLTYGGLLEAVGAPASGDPVDKVYKAVGVRRGRDETLSDFLGKLGRVPLKYQPGERWMYSLATDVCGALVERISGKRFDRFLQEELFEPLGMKDTAFHVKPKKRDRFAANYSRGEDKITKLQDDPTTSAYLEEPTFFSGGGGLVSTLEDYRRFCEMLRRGGEFEGERILGRRTVEMMRNNHLRGGEDLASMAIDSFSETANAGVGFGLGFAMTLDEVKSGVLGEGDFYWGGAASTIFWVDPREDLICIFLTQLMPSGTFNFRGQLKNLVYSALD